MITIKRTCPICRRQYTQAPALSRKDNRTEICPDCGVDEALDAFFSAEKTDRSRRDERMQMRSEIHRIMKDAGCGNS